MMWKMGAAARTSVGFLIGMFGKGLFLMKYFNLNIRNGVYSNGLDFLLIGDGGNTGTRCRVKNDN